MVSQKLKERKTTGAQKSGRASRVINDVLSATCEELDQVGYAQLSVEDVATRAGVNKTTIYRRWPTKSELVVNAIREYYKQSQEFPDTGTLKQDLLEYVRLATTRIQNPMARGAMVALNNFTDPALQPLAEELLSDARNVRTSIVKRAVDRGELPKHTDCALIGEMFSAPIMRKLLTLGETVAPSYVESVIDIVIAGANAITPRSRPKSTRKIAKSA